MKRLLSGLVAAAIILFSSYLETPWPLFAVSSIGMLVCWFEFIQSSQNQIFSALYEKSLFFLLLFISFLAMSLDSHIPLGIEIFCVCFALLTVQELFSQRLISTTLPNLLLFYLAVLPGLSVSLLFLDSGKFWFLYMMFVVFFGDIFAFYIGAKFGRRKLLPKVSPKKTWEGSIAGLFGSTLVSIFFVALFGPGKISVLMAAGLGLTLGFFGQIGDFFESNLKRSLSLKDAGSIMPGHGGLLDRLDGIFFAGPILLLFLKTFGF